MGNKLQTNLSKIEKRILWIYIGIIVFTKLIFDEIMIGNIILIAVIVLMAMKKSNIKEANYLVKEKLKLIIRHFFMICILWNIIFRILEMESIYENSLLNLALYTVILIIFILPFLGFLKAISEIKKVDTYANVELYREVPQNIEPAVIAYLMQDKVLDKSDISATLLDLIRRGYLIMRDDIDNGFDNVANGILNKKLIINYNKNLKELKGHEQFLISWFSKTSENLQEINMNKLKEMLKESKMLKSDYDKWEQLVEKEASKLKFYDDSSKLAKLSKFSAKWAKKLFMISMCLIILAMIGNAFNYIINLPTILIYVIVFLFFTHFVLSTLSIIIYDLRLPTQYLNPLGQENIRKWNGFIKFLKQFTLISERGTEEIHIWEEYLVYGVAFGVAKETIDNMNEAYGLNSYVK